MNKSIRKILFGLGSIAAASFGLGCAKPVESENVLAAPKMAVRLAEEEPEAQAKVVIEKVEHGTIEADISEGNIGDVCVITAKHDLLYKVERVSVNGVDLIEDKEIVGKYSFVLSAGENKVEASFILDEALLGELTTVVKQIEAKDWSNLFSVDTILILVKWVIDGGILIAVIRYYIKDKRLEKKLEEKVQSTIKEIIPDSTKNTVVATIESVITPLFSQITADNIEIKKAMSIFSKCMALSQENTPESRRAILDELSGLKIADLNTIDEAKEYISKLVEEHEKKYQDVLMALSKIGESNKAIIEEKAEEKAEEEVVEKENIDNGTQI